ncbi:hypothetical protein [Hydrogenophaga sp.]|uniref:hypothetical protein n=1 Tax=Hydrogenophaga sp. TaxID=1904254 RepID=UPI002FCC322B
MLSPVSLCAAYHPRDGEEIPGFPQYLHGGFQQTDMVSRSARIAVYLVVMGWMYVVLMMSVAEATNTTGSVLGAIVTFFLYGLLPVILVVYLMRTPARRKAIKAREAAEHRAQMARLAANAASVATASIDPDAGGHAPGAAQADSIAPVRKET